MKVQEISIDGFDYPLPDARIAAHPLSSRDECRLLVCGHDGEISDSRFSSLPSLIPSGALLVCNDTRVINARVALHKASGARIEVFLLEPADPADYNLAFQTRGQCSWKALVGNLRRWKGETLRLSFSISGHDPVSLSVDYVEPDGDSAHIVRFSWTPAEIPFAEILEAIGRIPIPPYLNRESQESDNVDYQTVFSRVDGSVAAPTAGLHFTPRLMDRLRQGGVQTIPLTLHVGAGTFRPVKSSDIGGHQMHSENFILSRSSLAGIISALHEDRPVFAVGTTSVRTLESLPILGHAVARGDRSMHVAQWDAYSPDFLASDTLSSLRSLLDFMDREGLQNLSASTSVMIAPGFRWRIVSGLVTNFHQPRSTLLLLVASFLGDSPESADPLWRKVYSHALAGDYRFLSYGDACLFMPRSR